MSSKKRALVAESDPFQSVRLSRVLESLDYAVTEASNGLSAKEAIDRGSAQDLLVADLSLPECDGFALIEHLRRRKENSHAFVVAISGFPSLRATALKNRVAMGIDDVLSKTYDEATLTQILKRSGAVLEQRLAQEMARAEGSEQREMERLALIASMNLLDAGPQDAGLQKLVEDAAKIFHVPVALISLVLKDKQWFKAHTGLSGKLLAERGTPRDQAFCAHVVQAEVPETLVVPDAAQHPCFKDNPLVLDGTIRSYVGSPLKAPGGQVYGTLCLIDSKPGTMKAADVALLEQLARRVAGELELRRQRSELLAAEAELEDRLGMLAAAISQMGVGVLLMDEKRNIIVSNRALADMVGRPLSEVVKGTGADFARANIGLFDDPTDYLSKMKLLPEGPYVADEVYTLQRPYPRRVRWMAKPIALRVGQGQLDLFIDLD